MTVTIKLRYCLLQLLVIALLACTNLQAARPDRSPGVYIPLLKNNHAGEFTDTSWVSGVQGTYLEVRANREGVWNALDQALTSLGIKALRKDPAAGEWLTDWVVWKYDRKTGKAQSKPGFSLRKQSLERHRFLFTLKAGDSADRVRIVATDITRQREVDITPDSEYSWMEWKDRDPQQEAANTFLQRLQVPIESALATRFVVSRAIVTGKDGVAVVADTDSRTDADVQLISIPRPAIAVKSQPVQVVQTPVQPVTTTTAIAAPDRGVATTPLSAEPPALTPAVTEPVTRPGLIAVDGVKKSRKAVAAAPAIAERALATPERTRTKTVTAAAAKAATVQHDYLDLAPGEPQARAPSKSGESMTVQPVAVPGPATNGLLVRAAPAATWPALLQSLGDLDIAIEQIDERQHTLQTVWVDFRYDSKNQLLVMQSKDKPLWAFSLSGKGIERHRFQVVMVPANNATQAIIYAYHTGYQEQVDLTPDSEQTMLAWKDREASPEVALALLRKLRIIIPH